MVELSDMLEYVSILLKNFQKQFYKKSWKKFTLSETNSKTNVSFEVVILGKLSRFYLAWKIFFDYLKTHWRIEFEFIYLCTLSSWIFTTLGVIESWKLMELTFLFCFLSENWCYLFIFRKLFFNYWILVSVNLNL